MQQKQQTILATLSLGPVGISDQLTERPTMLPPSSRVPNPNAKISSNKDLVMATCAATGDLLQPSYPLAPLDKMLTGFTNGDAPFFSLWGTYTAVPAQDGSVNLWYLAYCFGTAGKHKPGAQVILEESDLGRTDGSLEVIKASVALGLGIGLIFLGETQASVTTSTIKSGNRIRATRRSMSIITVSLLQLEIIGQLQLVE